VSTHPLRRPRTALAVTALLASVAAPAAADAATPTTANYTLGGAAKINARVKGTIPLSGTVAATIAPDTGALTADVKINTVTANLVEFGAIPIKAKVAFESVGQATGQLTGTTLTTTTNQTIRLLTANVLGVNIVQGSGCRTVKPSAITLTSGAFAVQSGGTLTGSFAISALTGCGALNWDLSDAITSTNNTVAAKLTAR
jgi:uncharacterized protein (DUF2342 family)